LTAPTATQTLPGAFQASAERVPDRVALRTPGGAACLTWADYGAAVERVAGALAGLGLGRGDRIVVLSRNRPELAICEVGALHLGAACAALYVASPATTIEHVLADSEPAVLLVESALESRLTDVEHSVGHVLSLDGPGEQLTALESILPPAGFDFTASWRSVQGDDLAALVYTSGTTGRSKAAEWTQRQALESVRSFDIAYQEPDGVHDISFAPFAALSERYAHWHALLRGSTRTMCEDPTQLGIALVDSRPTRVAGPPQVWQRLRSALIGTLKDEEREILETAIERTRALARGQSPKQLSEAEEGTLELLRSRLGLENVNLAGSSSAPCPPATLEHYLALGLRFAEFYAMTETGVVAGQRSGIEDIGTVGKAMPGYELQIADDGEVLVRSSCASNRYRNRPQDTAQTYGADGWIHTGDLGKLDMHGRLRLIGRKKEMIIPEHGHNVAPAAIESALKDACPHIAHACLVGDSRPHLVALVVMEPSDLAEDERACGAVVDAIARVNTSLEPREQILAHAILSDTWLPGDGYLTETLKMRRPQIAERYATTIDQLYAAAPARHLSVSERG
jgi:long-chain acyl-CoA synthetase